MLTGLMLSSTVKALGSRLAVIVCLTFASVWVAGITIFWHFTITEVANKDQTLNTEKKTDSDKKLPVTLVTGFLGSGEIV
jgi:hypothetical protein